MWNSIQKTNKLTSTVGIDKLSITMLQLYDIAFEVKTLSLIKGFKCAPDMLWRNFQTDSKICNSCVKTV